MSAGLVLSSIILAILWLTIGGTLVRASCSRFDPSLLADRAAYGATGDSERTLHSAVKVTAVLCAPVLLVVFLLLGAARVLMTFVHWTSTDVSAPTQSGSTQP